MMDSQQTLLYDKWQNGGKNEWRCEGVWEVRSWKSFGDFKIFVSVQTMNPSTGNDMGLAKLNV
jgi:hypothetical protein